MDADYKSQFQRFLSGKQPETKPAQPKPTLTSGDKEPGSMEPPMIPKQKKRSSPIESSPSSTERSAAIDIVDAILERDEDRDVEGFRQPEMVERKLLRMRRSVTKTFGPSLSHGPSSYRMSPEKKKTKTDATLYPKGSLLSSARKKILGDGPGEE